MRIPLGSEPVSYTHLDVYKRQVGTGEDRQLGAGLGLQERIEIVVGLGEEGLRRGDRGQRARTELRGALDRNGCLLYTSRCV